MQNGTFRIESFSFVFVNVVSLAHRSLNDLDVN